MQNYSKLVEAMRLIGKEQDCNECEAGKWHRDINCCLFEDAADAIEALQADVKDAFDEGYNAGYTAGIGYCSFKRAKMEVQDGD